MKKTKEQVSYNMSRIRSRDTKIELALRKALWKKGIRYRKNYSGLPGTPDIAITKYKIAIFCDSEFFHGNDWENLQKQIKKGKNPDFWITKISGNMERDSKVEKELRALGWSVLRFWGKDISKHIDECVSAVEETIFETIISAAADEDS